MYGEYVFKKHPYINLYTLIFKNPSPRALDVQELFPLPNFCTWSLGGSSDCAQMGL